MVWIINQPSALVEKDRPRFDKCDAMLRCVSGGFPIAPLKAKGADVSSITTLYLQSNLAMATILGADVQVERPTATAQS